MLDLLSYRQWALAPDYFNRVGTLVWRLLLEGKSPDRLIEKMSEEDIINRFNSQMAAETLVVDIGFDRDARVFTASTQFGQNIAMVPIFGSMTKNGGLCSYGMRDMIGMIQRANKSDKISAIVLDMETPGGTVDGTNELGLAVKQSKKPVVAFGDGMVASAGYWVASQAKEIYGNKNNPTEFGSIGVLYIHENWEAYIQKEIGSVEIIRAPQSTDKARVNVIEPLTDDQRLDIRQELKQIAQEFISTVKKGRGDRLQTEGEDIFTGKMYKSKEARKMGMIDQLGTLQDAINRAGELSLGGTGSSKSKSEGNTGTKPNANTTMKFKSNIFSKFFGKSEEAEKQNSEANDQISASATEVDEKVAELESENQKLKEERDQLKADNEAKATKIAELEQKVKTSEEESKAKIEELQKKLDAKPAGNATTVVKEGDPEGEPEKDKFRTSVDDEVDQILNENKK